MSYLRPAYKRKHVGFDAGIFPALVSGMDANTKAIVALEFANALLAVIRKPNAKNIKRLTVAEVALKACK